MAGGQVSRLNLARQATQSTARFAVAAEVRAELGITRQTPYRFVGPNGGSRDDGQRMLDRRQLK